MPFFTSHRFAVAAGLLILIVSLFIFFRYSASGLPLPADIGSYDATAEKGSYLATVGNCSTCHTAENGPPFAGGVAFRTPFGTLYSTNITMDEETGIGRWSFPDFYQSMKQGLRPDGTHLYPAFPYTDFAKMTDSDIASVYLYLQTLTPVTSPARPDELAFPYNIRSLLFFWKALFHSPAAYKPTATRSQEWNRGAYLVEGPGHCGACHTPRNFLGAERNDLALTGGVYLDKVKTGRFRQWSAINLTQSRAGLARWRAQDIASYLKSGQSRYAIVHGPMNEVVLNSTSYLEDVDIRAIATYLKALPANAQEIGDMPGEDTLAAGETVYTVHCGSCHLPTGLGDEGLGVPLEGNAIVQTADPSSLLNVILYGPHLPAPPFVSERTRMKMFGKRLSDKDIANVASYIRSSFGNYAGAVTPGQVNRQR
jgi:mono/diheme cytochrome c family protein